jgi:hypothetical protein
MILRHRWALGVLVTVLWGPAPGAWQRPLPTPVPADAYIVLYDRTNYRGNPANYRGVVSSTGRRTTRSVTIGDGRWELCEGPNFSGRCVVLDRSVPDLGRYGLSRVGSARPQGGAVQRPDRDPYIVLYEDTNYRRNPRNISDAMGAIRPGRARSITIGFGTWEICQQPNFNGRCLVLDRSVPDLGRIGFRDRVRSARPVRPARPARPQPR